MKYEFNGKVYRKGGGKGTSYGNLIFDIFQYYLEHNPTKSYLEIQSLFNPLHKEFSGYASTKKVVFNVTDYDIWYKSASSDTKRDTRYFLPIKYNKEQLYFTTQWGNKSGEYGNINKFIDFTINELNYEIKIINDTKEKSSDNKGNTMDIKNIMLYGAPGVGKTHNYKRLISMIENGSDEKTIFDTISINETTEKFDDSIFENIKNDERIEFITFHQNYSYEDFIEGFRPHVNGNIKLENGVLKKIINQINIDYKDLSFTEIIKIYKDFILSKISKYNYLDMDSIKGYHLPDKYIKYDNCEDNNCKYYIKINNEINLIFRSNTGGHSSSLKLLDIEKLYIQYDYVKDNDFDLDIISKLLFPDYIDELSDKNNKIFYLYDILSFVDSLKDFIENKIRQQNKNFYIVIDEINRGNISKIFGELITLIEEDKRDSYEVTLPYSKEKFKIPSNFYIIATMNSTDKSIATIDIALRRRFTFLKMKPNSSLVKNEKAQKLMGDLNDFISNKDKGNLGEDYQLGHSYFMNIDSEEDLEFVKKYKIQPLLEEYFYGDEKNYNEALKTLDIK